MKHLTLLIVSSLVVLLYLSNAAIAETYPAVVEVSSRPILAVGQTLIQDFKAEILPEVEKILTPEQSQQLEAAVIEGKQSLRKVFKTIGLTPDQKTKLASTFKALPSKEALSVMTSAEKKAFFLKQKSAFMPASKKIGDKISAKLKLAKDKISSIPAAESISQKISKKMEKLKEQFSSSSDS